MGAIVASLAILLLVYGILWGHSKTAQVCGLVGVALVWAMIFGLMLAECWPA